jgi:hypothetical protein
MIADSPHHHHDTKRSISQTAKKPQLTNKNLLQVETNPIVFQVGLARGGKPIFFASLIFYTGKAVKIMPPRWVSGKG